MKFNQLLLTPQLPSQSEMMSWLKIPFKTAGTNHAKLNGLEIQPTLKASLMARSQAQALTNTLIGDWVLSLYTLIESNCSLQPTPRNSYETRSLLQKLRGRCYKVHTGLMLFDPSRQRERMQFVTTRVWLRKYTDEELDTYLAHQAPWEKQRAYISPDLIAHIDGCYANILGCPLCSVASMLESWGLYVNLNIQSICRKQLGFTCEEYHFRTVN